MNPTHASSVLTGPGVQGTGTLTLSRVQTARQERGKHRLSLDQQGNILLAPVLLSVDGSLLLVGVKGDSPHGTIRRVDATSFVQIINISLALQFLAKLRAQQHHPLRLLAEPRLGVWLGWTLLGPGALPVSRYGTFVCSSKNAVHLIPSLEFAHRQMLVGNSICSKVDRHDGDERLRG